MVVSRLVRRRARRPNTLRKTLMNKRFHERLKGVLPVKLSGRSSDGTVFEEIVHTLDITPTGARLGALRHSVQVQDRLTVRYRQRKTEFRVVWIESLKNTSESQVGLQTVAPGNPWRL
jgi:hypothetical protein